MFVKNDGDAASIKNECCFRVMNEEAGTASTRVLKLSKIDINELPKKIITNQKINRI